MSAPPPAAPDPNGPLTDSELAAAMAALGPFERRPRLAVAVSGGPDSLALALLADAWARPQGGEVQALTVDHGLRPGSAAEAAQVAAWLAQHRIPCRLLLWEGAKPVSGVQAAARAARYRLLEAACREAGILHLLLAHHADDLAETACMRAERGSGEGGLAAIPAIRERDGLRLLRPLLHIRRHRLEAVLRAQAQPWLVDPSNSSPGFRRGRLRADPEFDPEPWAAIAARAATARATLEGKLARVAADIVRWHPLGHLSLALEPWRQLPPPLATGLLARAIATVTGGVYPPAQDGIAALARRLAAGPVRATLGGARLIAARRLLVIREAGRIRETAMLRPGDALWWDSRFMVRYLAGPGGLTLAPLGGPGRFHLPAGVRREMQARAGPAAAVEALPALWHQGRPLASPLHACGIEARFHLRPARPLVPAPFAGVNVV